MIMESSKRRSTNRESNIRRSSTRGSSIRRSSTRLSSTRRSITRRSYTRRSSKDQYESLSIWKVAIALIIINLHNQESSTNKCLIITYCRTTQDCEQSMCPNVLRRRKDYFKRRLKLKLLIELP